MVVEIPRWSNAKMEIATKEPLNPIKQVHPAHSFGKLDSGFYQTGFEFLDVVNVVEVGRILVVDVDAEDLPVRLAVINHGKHSQDLK